MPAFEYWITIDAAYFVGAFIVSFVLGLLDVGHVRRAVVMVLLVLSAGIMSLGLWSTAQRVEEAVSLRNQIEGVDEAVTGGSNFAYIRVRPHEIKTGNLIALTITGAVPGFQMGIYPLANDGVPGREQWITIGRQSPNTIHVGNISIKPGRYRIDFLMGNRKWVEFLEFWKTDNGIGQVYYVEEAGNVIHRGE